MTPDEPTERIKVYFGLERDDEGWPPADGEDLWAVLIGPRVARIDSIPLFVRNIALDDLVQVENVSDGRATFAEKLKWSGNCTLRVIPMDDDVETGVGGVLQALSAFGVEAEAMRQYAMVAVNARPSADLAGIKRVLDAGEE
ncbi:DUF4265 domain-containing protein, partial [Actinoplanes sp. NPDC051633]|uniref:DUF4265 domain-containing protein n=1 Tax=Actinoplanes sp. NPDC051633 TaxID=3155670 RepID=UPI0034315D2D